jgi:hypothetical protein
MFLTRASATFGLADDEIVIVRKATSPFRHRLIASVIRRKRMISIKSICIRDDHATRC